MSLSEARRRDLFTLPEKRILACFATSQRKRLDVKEALRVAGPEAVQELKERAYAVEYDGQLQLAVPLFGEYLAGPRPGLREVGRRVNRAPAVRRRWKSGPQLRWVTL